MIRLGIVDDHAVFRLGLIRTFEREPDLAVTWELPGLTDLSTMLEAQPVDVVLMDLSLGPDQDALAATKAIREKYDSTRVIVVSASLDWDAATAARAAGASGYLPKDLSIADMVEAIRALSSPNFGRSSFTDMLETRPKSRNASVPRWSTLTKREHQVLGELRVGRSNKEIAVRLGVSMNTVNKHVQQVLKKLRVRTRSQAIAMVAYETSGRHYAVPMSAVDERPRRNGHF